MKRIHTSLHVYPLWVISCKAYDAYTVCCWLEYCIVLYMSTWKPVLVKKIIPSPYQVFLLKKKKINFISPADKTLLVNTPQACRAQNCWNTASMWWSSSAVNRRFSRVTMYCWIIWWCWQTKNETQTFIVFIYIYIRTGREVKTHYKSQVKCFHQNC